MQGILPVASGKGGVGKSVFCANLGLALARLGKAVVLVDLDLGGSNLHTCLGLKNRHPGLGSLVWKSEKSLSALLVETGYERLWLIPGDNLLPGTANFDWNTKRRVVKELAALPADFVILDLGAGSSYNVVDFYLAAPRGCLVLAPEITSVLNAYSFLKTAAYRSLVSAFPAGSEERAAVLSYGATKTEGSGLSYLDFARELAGRFPARGPEAAARLASLSPLVVMNRGRGASDAELGYRLRDITRKNLGFDIEFSGFLLEDEAVPRSVAARTPLLARDPQAPFARGVSAIASRLAASPAVEAAAVEAFCPDDLSALAEEALS